MIMSSDELYNRLVDYDLEDPFLALEDRMENIKYFSETHPRQTSSSDNVEFVFFTEWIDNKLVGLCKLKTGGSYCYSHPECNDWVSFLSVDKDYQKQGISTKILNELFKYLLDNDYKKILISGYSKNGFQFLRKNILELGCKYSIEIIDEDKATFS